MQPAMMHSFARQTDKLAHLVQIRKLTTFSVAQIGKTSKASNSKAWRWLGNSLIFGSGLAFIGATDLNEPAHLLEPEICSGIGAVNAALVAASACRGRPSALIAAPHLVAASLQAYQLARWTGASPIHEEGKPRTRVVILGSGWGAASLLKALDKRLTAAEGGNQAAGWYDVTVISPRNCFVYTPLLPAAVTGTVETRSIVESTRSILRGKGTYHEAECLSVDPERKVIYCRYNKPSRNLSAEHSFELPYDKLIVAVGAVTNDFRTPGVKEHAFFLKEASDAAKLRARISECFELASLPGTTQEQRKQLLTFCVVGGGPTGVEAAAELHDLLVEDLLPLYPDIRDAAHIKLIETRDHILSTFDRHISEFATTAFARQGIEVVFNSRVKAVLNDGVMLKLGDVEELQKLTAGTVLWATGIKQNPLSESLAAALPKSQQGNRHALDVDDHLVVKGSNGSIFALGDAANVEQRHAMDHAEELFKLADVNHDGILSCAEVRNLIRIAKKDYPQLAEHERWFDCGEASGLQETLQDLVTDTSSWLPGWLQSAEKKQEQASLQQCAEAVKGQGADVPAGITQQQFRQQLEEVDKSLRALPATAQVANQQGKYLASVLNGHRVRPQPDAATPNGLPPEVPRFKYRHLGIGAYIGGDEAVLELATDGKEKSVLVGYLCGVMWKSMESAMQLSARNQILVSRDWVMSKLFGRDISDA